MTETSSLRLLTAVLFLGAILIFWNLAGDALIHWDEGRTAERAREILVFNDWLTIHLNYRPDFAKPPLYYWLTALLYQIIGVNEFAARFCSALFGVLGLYAVYRLGALLFSAMVGTVAAALLLTVTFYLEYARAAMLDTGLLSFGVLALCAFLSHSLLLGWTFLGIGFMLKGPWIFSFLLPVPIWWFTQNRWEALRDSKLYLGLEIFLLVVLPWHMTQYALHGQVFLDSYMDKEIITRIQQPLNSRDPDLLFYPAQLAEKWHVWFYWFLIGHFVVGWRGQEGKVLAFLDLWILVVLLILTFGIRTQMIRYTLALYPAIAIVVAYFVLHALVHLRWDKHLVILSGGIALALFSITEMSS
jgi:4-amino-4-deoxy-L-arabinose transferase-like glycosyltransferase